MAEPIDETEFVGDGGGDGYKGVGKGKLSVT